MPIQVIAEIRKSALASIVLLVAISFASVANAEGYEAIQLVRDVLETDQLQNYENYRRQVSRGTLFYDNEYRPPNDPPGPTPIDCAKTRRIGVTFGVKRSRDRHDERVMARFVWTHSNVKSDDPDMQWTATYSILRHFNRGENTRVYSDGLILTDKLKVDGIISIRVSVGKNEVLRNSFSLSQCNPGT